MANEKELREMAARQLEAAAQRLRDDDGSTEYYFQGPECFERYEESPSTVRQWALEELESPEPDGRWHEEIGSTQWGVLVPVEGAEITGRRDDPTGEFAFICDYELSEMDAEVERKPDQRRSVTLTEADWVAVSEALEIAAESHRACSEQTAILRAEGVASHLLAASSWFVLALSAFALSTPCVPLS